MATFDNITSLFNLPGIPGTGGVNPVGGLGAAGSIGSLIGGGGLFGLAGSLFGGAAAPPAPAAPTLVAPTPQGPAVMPTLTSGVGATQAAINALARRQGRASTILTKRRKRTSSPTGGINTDTFSAQTLSGA